MKKIISTLLILGGIVLLLMPTIKNKVVESKTKEVNKIIENISVEEILQNQETEVEFDYEAIEDVDAATVIFSTTNFDNKNIIGQLKIPELNMELPLLKGVTNSNLAVGATTMKKDQIMGAGNYPLAGHYMKNKDLLFGSLMDIEVGNIVYMTDKENIYEYEIYDTVVVPDTAMHMLEDSESEKKGKPIISLMTCYYSSKTEKRFFALGELIDQYPMEEENKD